MHGSSSAEPSACMSWHCWTQLYDSSNTEIRCDWNLSLYKQDSSWMFEMYGKHRLWWSWILTLTGLKVRNSGPLLLSWAFLLRIPQLNGCAVLNHRSRTSKSKCDLQKWRAHSMIVFFLQLNCIGRVCFCFLFFPHFSLWNPHYKTAYWHWRLKTKFTQS